MSACVDHPFSVSSCCCCSIYICIYICLPFFFPLSLSVSFLSFFYFFLCICSRRLYPTTLDYARKIGNPGPHYSTVFNFFFFFLFVAVFSRSSGFRTFLLRPFVPVYLVLVQPLVSLSRIRAHRILLHLAEGGSWHGCMLESSPLSRD